LLTNRLRLAPGIGFVFVVLLPCLAMADGSKHAMAISEYQKQEWHVEDGLPQSNVRTIIQGRDRRLLIGSSEGITAFDGRTFAPFNICGTGASANEPINALLISRNGDLWIGTDDRGVLRQSGSQVTAVSEDAGFHQERVRGLFEDRAGNIWVATHNRVERIAGSKVEAFDSLGLVPGDITEPFAEDGQGRVFIVTGRGLFLHDGSRTVPLDLHYKELGSITAVYGDDRGTVWVGRSQGVVHLTIDGQGNFSQTAFPTVHGPAVSLIVDHDGNLWVGTKGHGICRVSEDGQVTHWTMQNGLPDDTIRTFFADDEGNLWIGTLSGGLSRWRKSTLVPFGAPEGFPNSFAANVLGDRRGALWLGTWGSGLLRLHNGKLQQEFLAGSPHSDPIRSLAEDYRGNIWIGTWFDGLYRYDGTKFEHFLTGRESPSNAMSVLYGDKSGNLWVGTYTGLLLFRNGVPQKNKGEMFLPDMLITSLKEDVDGSLLVGTFKGLFRLRDSVVQAITEKDGLSNSFVLSVSRDSMGSMWVGTKAGGLDLVRGRQVMHIPAEAGLHGFPVYSALDDGRGMLWLSTTRGLLRVPVQQLHDLAEGKRKSVESYLMGRNDGMRSSECGGMSQPPASRTPEGELWFATAKGFVHTNPSLPASLLPPLRARISGLQIDHVEIPVSEKFVLAPGATELDVQFDTVRLSNPSEVQFRYKLDGYDRDSTTVSTHHAHYKHLPPGQYRFMIEARDAGQPWNGMVTEAKVVEQPYFYQTRWFYVLMVLSCAGIVAAIFRWRVAMVKSRMRLIMEERNRIGREWHDTLMAGLAAIAWQLEATRDRLMKETRGAAESLDLARNMVRHSQIEARRIIWDLQDNSINSVGALSKTLAKVLDAINTRMHVNAELRVQGEETSLSPRATHHLACICQEAVTNAIRHGAPTAIQVGVEYSVSRMTLSVKDDGCGFRTSDGSTPGHFGLSVMEERVRKLGGNLRIRSAPGKGTEIVVEIPMEKVA
jgi:signal transduction histidine kinase/ligand-binding sensor domain-containing protein